MRSSAPADYAFTHDPLTGAITRHEGGSAAQPAEGRAPASAKPIDLGVYQAPEPDRPAPPAATIAPWRELEPAGVPSAADLSTGIASSIPAPTAVH